jgi:hypothetical protein
MDKKPMNNTNTPVKPPICRFCLSEKDCYGNLVIVYDDGTAQHKTCAAKYARNRRNLKKVIFKEGGRYVEFFGDTRPAGLVDRKAMKEKGKSLKEIRKERRLVQKGIKEKMAYARKCKEERRLAKQKEEDKAMEEFIRQFEERRISSLTSLINNTQEREEG